MSTPANIIPSTLISTVDTVQYTVSSGRTIIDKFTVVNTAGVSVSFSCNLIPSGGSVQAENLIIDNQLIAVNETYNCPELIGQILENGGKISTIAGAAASLSIRANGREDIE